MANIKNIRIRVFETNSSSSHSLSIESGDLADVSQLLPPEIFKKGVVDIEMGEFGWNYEEYSGLLDKLSYVITDLASIHHLHTDHFGAVDFSAIYADPHFIKLNNIVFDYLGVKINLVGSVGYIDHQSAGFARAMIDNEVSLKQFLFNIASSFTTDNDNY